MIFINKKRLWAPPFWQHAFSIGPAPTSNMLAPNYRQKNAHCQERGNLETLKSELLQNLFSTCKVEFPGNWMNPAKIWDPAHIIYTKIIKQIYYRKHTVWIDLCQQ
jgi:hypothetical protein